MLTNSPWALVGKGLPLNTFARDPCYPAFCFWGSPSACQTPLAEAQWNWMGRVAQKETVNLQPNDFPHEKTSNQKPNSDSVSLAYIFDVGLNHPAPNGRLAIPTLLLSNICHHGDGNPTVAPINPAKRSGSIELEPILLGTDRYCMMKPWQQDILW